MTHRSKPLTEQILDDPIQAWVQQKASELARQPGFSRSDQPDIEQDLREYLLRAIPKFDPRRVCSRFLPGQSFGVRPPPLRDYIPPSSEPAGGNRPRSTRQAATVTRLSGDARDA